LVVNQRVIASLLLSREDITLHRIQLYGHSCTAACHWECARLCAGDMAMLLLPVAHSMCIKR